MRDYFTRVATECKGLFDVEVILCPEPLALSPAQPVSLDLDQTAALIGRPADPPARSRGPAPAARSGHPTSKAARPLTDPRPELALGPNCARSFLPPKLLADRNLCATAKLVATALVQIWARFKDHCWPSNRTIARAINRSEGHVQRCLCQLERAGWIKRESAAEVRSGRRIWLTWRLFPPPAEGGGGSAPAQGGGSAPARSELKIGIVKEEKKLEEPEPVSPPPQPQPDPESFSSQRSRPEPAPVPPPTLVPTPTLEATDSAAAPETEPAPPPTASPGTDEPTGKRRKTAPPPKDQKATRSRPVPPSPPSSETSAQQLAPNLAAALGSSTPRTASRTRQNDPAVGPVRRPTPPACAAPQTSETAPQTQPGDASEPAAGPVVSPGPQPLPSAPSRSSPPQPVPAAPAGPLMMGLSPQEQERLKDLPKATQEKVLEWLALQDPILLREARRLLAPPRPAEPSPQQLATRDLLSRLPGRPDWIIEVADRLARELRDQKSFRYYESVAVSVSRREQSAEALLQAWEQGLNPQARNSGAVFATVWKRETRSSKSDPHG